MDTPKVLDEDQIGEPTREVQPQARYRTIAHGAASITESLNVLAFADLL
jgi:hypothetical protein